MEPDLKQIERACALLDQGEIVAIPTETVYGLAADARNGEAVAKVFEAKGRPQFNPLIVHVSDRKMAEAVGIFDPISARLADRFWPGPLSIVLPLRPDHQIHPLVSAGLPTIAIRMPLGASVKVIEMLGRPIAAPSANRSGRISATSAQAVRDELGDRIAYVLEGGKTSVGVESTIVKVEGDQVRLLRQGGVTQEEIENLLGLKMILPEKAGAIIEAPGMLASHYAPDAAVRINALSVGQGEALLAFGPDQPELYAQAKAMLNLSPTGCLREAAANLYAYMQELDRSGAATIAIMPIPAQGLGLAINDRLERAAAPR